MAQPARPRPRPRLVSRQPVVGGTQVTNTVNDEDDLFRRNRGRTTLDWRQLEQSSAKATPFVVSDDDLDTVDRAAGSSPKPRKKKKLVKPNDRPRWQGTDVARILSSDDEDEDIQIIGQTSGNPQENMPPNKCKRKRSRSRSITPPPALPAHFRANVVNLVRQALAVQPRPPTPPSPTFPPDDLIDLDPELAKIAETIRQQVKRAHVDPQNAGGPEVVNIKVHWRPHPRNISAKEQFWAFKLQRHDTFREVFDGVADLAGVMTDQLVINHDHKRVFASATPHSLHMWAEGELEACDKHTAEYIRAQRDHRASSPSLQDSTFESSPAAPPSDVDSDSDATGETIKLVLRSVATKDKTFSLTVRSTTTCGAIVRAFLKVAGLPDSYSRGGLGKRTTTFPQLMVDGDKMDFGAEIGDAELEDGDLVEVVGV